MPALRAAISRLTHAQSTPARWGWWALAATLQGLFLVLCLHHRRWLRSLHRHHDEDRRRRWQQYCDARIALETSHSLDARDRARHFADRVELEHARLDGLVKLFARELAALEPKIEAAKDFSSLAALRCRKPCSVRE